MECLGFPAICCIAICCDWNCDWVSWLVMFNHMLLCIYSIIFPYWPYLIISSLTTWSNCFPSGYLSELSLITDSLFLLIIKTLIFFPSPPLGIWWKTLPTIFRIIWLVRPRPHIKYSMKIHPNITGSFNYYGILKV